MEGAVDSSSVGGMETALLRDVEWVKRFHTERRRQEDLWRKDHAIDQRLELAPDNCEEEFLVHLSEREEGLST